MNYFVYLLERLMKPKHEPEHEEKVEHDVVMERDGGRLTEVTAHDSEVRQ